MFSLIPLPYKILAIILVIAGAAWWGYARGSARADAAIADYRAGAEKQISDLRAENLKISSRVTVEYVDRTNTIREREVVYRQAATNLQPQAELSNGWIYLHDAAARLINPDMQLAQDRAPSGIMDNTALAVVTSNYAICRRNSEQLVALQNWITETRASVEASNTESQRR